VQPQAETGEGQPDRGGSRDRTGADGSAGREKYLTVLLACLAVALFVMLAWPLWTNRLYSYNDFFAIHIPFRYVYSQALKSGESILWTPHFYCGYYIHAEGEAGMCHPLHWALYGLLPFTAAFNLEFLLNYVFLFAGMVLLLRRWTAPVFPGGSGAAAWTGALIFTFSGFSILHFMHINALGVVSHVPWLLLACDVLIGSNDLRKMALAQLAIALLTGSQNLMGYPQFVVLSMMCEGSFVLWRAATSGHWWRLILFALAIALGFVIAAIQLLPQRDFLAYSDRSETSLEFREWFSMHPLNVVQLWAPFVFRDRYCAEGPFDMLGRHYETARVVAANTHEMGLYTAAFATVALAWLAIRWRRLPSRWFVLATFLFAVLMLLIAFGKYTFIYPLVAELPIMRSFPFRCPTRYSMLTELAMAVLAAFAVADLAALQRRQERVNWRALWPLAVPLLLAAATAAAALAAISQPNNSWTPSLSSTREVLAGFALIAAAVVLTVAAARGVRFGLYGIILLTAGECGYFNIWDYLWTAGPPQTLEAMVASIPPPPEPPSNSGRLCHVENDHGNMLAVAGYDLMKGYTAFIPKDRVPMIRQGPDGRPALNVVALRLASIHWVLDPQNHWIPFTYWLPLTDWLPPARMVTQAVVSNEFLILDDAGGRVPAILATPAAGGKPGAWNAQGFDPATMAVVDRQLAIGPGPPGTAAIKAERPGLLEIETTAPTQQLLVLSERYHAGWRATIDGQPAEIVPAYGEYVSCVVPAGAKRITVQFMPASFVWGVRLTLLGLAAALLLAGGTLLLARRRLATVAQSVGR
jgi:hypothetical protein